MAQPKSDKIVLNIHYGDQQQCKLKIYKGTDAGDIMANIKQIVGIDDIICLDEDQDIIALSSSLPNGINIFIATKQQNKSQTMKPEINDNDNESKVSQIDKSLIYGYADRANGGNQKYSFDAGGSGEPIIFSNINKNGCCNIGNMLNPENGRFTAPINGIYSFTVSAWLKGGDANTAQLWFNYNGHRQQTFTSPIHNNTQIFCGTLTTEIKKNDYIDFRMYQQSFKGTTKEILENFHHTFIKWTLVQAL